MTNDVELLDVSEAKRRARAKLDEYRLRKQREREAKAAAEQSADEEIATLVRARRAEEEKRAEINAERQQMMAERQARLDADRKAEKEGKLTADPRLRIAATPARRVALKLRERMPDDVEFQAFLTEIRGVNFKQIQIELARIPDDERAAEILRQREELAAKLKAEAATLPEPECPEEVAILQRHGFAA